TKRLKLRKLREDDYDQWLPLFRQQGVARFLGLEHLPTPEEQCSLWFERSFKRYNENLGGMNVLIDKETGNLVGQSGLLVQNVDDQERLEVGYSILPQYWQKGYATEAARKCRDYAFENDYTESLISIIHIENVNSIKVAENNGMSFSHETIFKNTAVKIYRITKEEWCKLIKREAILRSPLFYCKNSFEFLKNRFRLFLHHTIKSIFV
ncbi:MAG TPA: GNAT family N-acetyltransferase, partial [Flavipsychrobacter sp.]|nr:GNAT family N-acetyltransferase [Flavipsychrobacter sp.]